MKYSTDEQAKKEIGRRLKEKIYNQGFNYAKLSAIVGISESYISRICSGYYIPSIETLYNITKPLNLNWKDLLEDLEYWITPKSFKFDSKDITEKDMEKYYKELFKEIDLIKMEANKTREEYDDIVHISDSGKKLTLKYISNDKFKVYDNSMVLLGINKDNVISYYAKKIPLNVSSNTLKNSFDFEKLYVIKFKSSRKSIIRKIYIECDSIIAIPYSKGSHYKPESFTCEELEGIYQAVSMTTSFKDSTSPGTN